ncbi:hypothetical protein [Rhizomonospora bruguierae]|uniref:hypothetical protein n=1 Tax=Rhizomonospora bruguierae TaxID=1581705 RepID=UPI001BCDB05D|nr:hypothetical protein [Micromonospora sp. NBRC 107566]
MDSQYRSRRCTVQDRVVCSSLVAASHSSRARRAAACEGKPPRRTRSQRPSRFLAEVWKYHDP